ncbi:MAG: serine/threonine protein kinase [Candidatus Eremiobacteraeota bacterium]|nr:serine/threonine protein kinase [Candidatus Eremiobacteraeota bacterium]MCW5867735.1 serine/threonine protein kinase [Candidatus Eremiobacteraeota bacterium]
MADITLTQDDGDELARLASTAGAAPSALSDYEIGRELGSGSFATCWSARHKRTGQEVAVKVIEVRPGQGMQQIAEIEHMVKVGRHPSILEVRDARLEGAHIYLISPLCQGSLVERVEQAYSLDQWLNWFIQAAEGLSLLHRCQIVHCDVKPANLLLDRHDHLLLADLGQARPLGDARPRMGSYFYMPPEQAEGGPPQASWDIYALGASFYWALTGYAPRSRSFVLEGEDHPTRLACYRRELPRAPLLQTPQIPAQYWPVLKRLLEVDPRRRPASMEAVLTELRRLKPGEKRASKGLLLAGLGLCLATALLAQVLRGGWLGELSLWGSLTIGVLGRLALVGGLAGGLAGAGLQAWEYQRNR